MFLYEKRIVLRMKKFCLCVCVLDLMMMMKNDVKKRKGYHENNAMLYANDYNRYHLNRWDCVCG